MSIHASIIGRLGTKKSDTNRNQLKPLEVSTSTEAVERLVDTTRTHAIRNINKSRKFFEGIEEATRDVGAALRMGRGQCRQDSKTNAEQRKG